MADLKQKIGLAHPHYSSPSISSPITPSEASTPRSGRCPIENLASISQALDGIQSLRETICTSHTNHNQAKSQIEQEIGAGNIDLNSGEGGKSPSEELQATSRAERESWDQVKNSQSTEFVMEDMDVDMDGKILCAFCPHPQDKALRITVHSLGGPLFLKNQPIGGALSKSVAGAFDRNVFVCDLSSVSANPSAVVPPKALWQAHASPVPCMHQSSFVSALITGASDGCIRLWDMKTKPTYPIGQYLHKKHVTGIEMLDGTTICSNSIDGTIQLWDIRCGTSPFMSAIPDKKPILNMASLPSSNMIAFTTRGGLFCLEVANSNSMVVNAPAGPPPSRSSTGTSAISSLLWPLRPLPLVGPCTGIKWNTMTGTEIYTSQPDGSITVFAK